MGNVVHLDVDTFPKELQLMLSIMKLDSHGGNSILSLLDQDTDWDGFLQFVRHHRVFPQIYLTLCRIGGGGVPQFVMQSLQQEYKRNTMLMLSLCAEMNRICGNFAEKQIPILVLKGPVLAMDLYGDISKRTSRDLDFLIQVKDLERVEELLLSYGYVCEEEDYKTVFNEWKWRRYHISYVHPEKQITVEIHWRLGHGPGLEPNFRDLWERRRSHPQTPANVFYLGKEDLFAYLVSHGARHSWFRLRWLEDIRRLLYQDLEWGKVVQLLKKNQILHIGGQSILLASELLDAPIHKEIQKLALRRRARKLSQQALVFIREKVNLHKDPPDYLAAMHIRYLFSIKSLLHKLLFILSFFHPYPRDVETFPLPAKLHFLYFPLRPFLWAWRKNMSGNRRTQS